MSLLDDAITWLKNSVPGVTVSSGLRTPAHNAKVGGVWDSYHLIGQAVDLTPPNGMSMSGLYSTLKNTFSSAGIKPIEFLNEGNHVHVAFAKDQDFGAIQAATNSTSIWDWFGFIKNIDVDGTTPDNVRSPTLAEMSGAIPDQTGRAKEEAKRLGISGLTLPSVTVIILGLILLAAGIFALTKSPPIVMKG